MQALSFPVTHPTGQRFPIVPCRQFLVSGVRVDRSCFVFDDEPCMADGGPIGACHTDFLSRDRFAPRATGADQALPGHENEKARRSGLDPSVQLGEGRETAPHGGG